MVNTNQNISTTTSKQIRANHERGIHYERGDKLFLWRKQKKETAQITKGLLFESKKRGN